MHAYLLIGKNIEKINRKISELAKSLDAKEVEFSLTKIDDVRNLNRLIRLTFDKPTIIVCKDINNAGEAALNAFLKNLEEPQENIYFALTSPSIRKILPTISSRCQIIKINDNQITEDHYREVEKFLKMTKGEQLKYVSKFKDRVMAIEFIENTVFFMHRCLHQKGLKYSIDPDNLDLALKTLTGLNANGNVNLQLSNFVINCN